MNRFTENVALAIREFSDVIGICLLMTGIGCVIAAFVMNEWRMLAPAFIAFWAVRAL